MDARFRGAEILPRTAVKRATGNGDLWEVATENTLSGNTETYTCSVLINAAGPWVDEVLRKVMGQKNADNIRLIARLTRFYGTRVEIMLDGVKSENDLGNYFGAGLYEWEVNCLREHEWVANAQDILFRHTKLGIRYSAREIEKLDAFLNEDRSG